MKYQSHLRVSLGKLSARRVYPGKKSVVWPQLGIIWQLIRRGATGELEQPRPQGAFPWLWKSALGTRLELEVEFKFQRGCCNLSLLFSPRRQRAPEGLLLGYYYVYGSHYCCKFLIIFTLLCLIPLNNKFKLTLVSHSRLNFKVVTWIINIWREDWLIWF